MIYFFCKGGRAVLAVVCLFVAVSWSRYSFLFFFLRGTTLCLLIGSDGANKKRRERLLVYRLVSDNAGPNQCRLYNGFGGRAASEQSHMAWSFSWPDPKKVCP
nr:hypothetical protein [Pandoravirus massiliensis]